MQRHQLLHWLFLPMLIGLHWGVRYVFSHMISITSFLNVRSRRLRPPFSTGQYSISNVILRFVLSFHMKFLIILIRADLMCLGIPWAIAKSSDYHTKPYKITGQCQPIPPVDAQGFLEGSYPQPVPLSPPFRV